MKRTAFLLMSCGAALAGIRPATARAADSNIALQTPTGTIFGTLTMPSTPAPPVPVVLIIAGSGNTDRDGNAKPIITANTYMLLAQALAQRGIASVRFDKRGVGASSGAVASEASLRFETYIADAQAWIALLKSDKRFSRIVVAGHSEGSLIGMIAAQEAHADAFVSLEGAGRPFATVLRLQLKPRLPAASYKQADAILTSLQNGQIVSDVPSELMVLFRPSVQPYLISLMKYDPAVEIAKLSIPTTVVQGTADVQVSMDDADALAKANSSAKLVVVDGMDHMLKQAGTAPSGALPEDGYTDPSKPVEPAVVGAVAHATGS